MELPYHQTQARMWNDVLATLTDPEFLEFKCYYINRSRMEDGKIKYNGIYQLIEDYRNAIIHFPKEK